MLRSAVRYDLERSRGIKLEIGRACAHGDQLVHCGRCFENVARELSAACGRKRGFQRAARNDARRRSVRHGVETFRSGHGGDIVQKLFIGKLEPNVRDALFAVYNRELGIGHKRRRGDFSARFEITPYARTAAFLVRPDYYPHSAFQFDAAVFKLFERVQADYDRALVVAYASAVNLSVFLDHLERRRSPAVARRHNVEMSQNAYALAAVAVLRVRASVVYILRF